MCKRVNTSRCAARSTQLITASFITIHVLMRVIVGVVNELCNSLALAVVFPSFIFVYLPSRVAILDCKYIACCWLFMPFLSCHVSERRKNNGMMTTT